jgi:hypothetical protein
MKSVYEAYQPPTEATLVISRPQRATLAPPKFTKVQTTPSPLSQYRANSRAGPGWEVFLTHTPLAPSPLVLREKKSLPGALSPSIQLQVSASALAPRVAPRIPSLQKIPPLRFEGTLLEGVATSMRPTRGRKV